MLGSGREDRLNDDSLGGGMRRRDGMEEAQEGSREKLTSIEGGGIPLIPQHTEAGGFL